MTILLYGKFDPAALENSYQRAFEVLGHRVLRFDVDQENGLVGRKNRVLQRLIRQVLPARRWLSRGLNAGLLARIRAEKPDLLLVFRGDFLMPKTVQIVREMGVKIVIFNPDNPFTGHPSARPEHRRAAREADAYLIWSEALASRLRENGVKAAHFFPFGWDPILHPHQPEVSPLHEVVFIGNWDRDRAVFLEKIAAVFPLKIWGDARWQRRTRPGSALRNCWQGGPLTGEAMTQVMSQSAVVLNLFRRQHRAGGIVMRTFEVPGAGGFLLSESNDDVQRLFPENETGAYFRDADECLLQLRHWLDHPAERRALARRAQQRVAGHFAYPHLTEILLTSLETGQWPGFQDWR